MLQKILHKTSPVKRNHILYYAYKFLEGFVLIYPVYMLFFRDKGFSFTDISWLLFIWASPVVLLEVLSGVLADRWSRKGVMVIGMVFKAAGFLIWWLVDGFPGAALGFVCWGIQEALCSGTQEAFLYDHLHFHNLAHLYDRAAGRGGFFMASGIALSTLAGGFVFSASTTLTLLLSSGSCLAAGLTALALREPPMAARTHGEGTGIWAHLLEGFRECFRNRTILSLLLVGSLAGSAYGLIDEFDSLWGVRAGVPVLFIGIWMAGRFGLEALGGQTAAWINRRLDLRRTGRLRAYVIIAGVLMTTAGLLPVVLGLPFYFSFYFMMAAGAVLVEQRLQEAIERAGRATVLSINSMITTLTAMGISLLMGTLADTWGLPVILILTGILCGLSALVLRSPSRTTPAVKGNVENTGENKNLEK